MRLKSFVRYAFGTHTEDLGVQGSTEGWGLAVVGSRILILTAALILAVASPPVTWLAVLLGGVVSWSLFRSLIRITFRDMTGHGWKSRSPARFVGLVFANLIEVVGIVAVGLASVESLQSTASFQPPVTSPGEALLVGISPFWGSSPIAMSGWAQLVSFTGALSLLFVTVVVIAAAVNGYQGSNPPSDDKRGRTQAQSDGGSRFSDLQAIAWAATILAVGLAAVQLYRVEDQTRTMVELTVAEMELDGVRVGIRDCDAIWMPGGSGGEQLVKTVREARDLLLSPDFEYADFRTEMQGVRSTLEDYDCETYLTDPEFYPDLDAS